MARVLIVDDDVASLAAARQAVRAAGHDPVAVTSAADARAALESPGAPEVLLVAPRADAGEALALATSLSDRGRPLVMLLGEAGGAPPGLPSLATPLVPATVAARIAAGLARLAAEAEARRAGASRAAPVPGPAGEQAPSPRPPSPVRSASVAAEAALRALFRRSEPGRPATVPPSPPPARPPDAPPGRHSAAGAPEVRTRDQAGPSTAAATWADLGAATAPVIPPPTPDLGALMECARTRDYFQVLGLPRDASGAGVRAAVSRLLNELDTLRLSAEGPAAALEELRQVIVDAGDVLGDDARRSHYLRAIAREGRG